MGTILVGYDDKDHARHALERGIAEAKRTGAHLVVVSVLELPLDPNAPRNFGTLGDGPVALMRGHGNVVVAPDIRRAVHRALYTEINAQQLATALSAFHKDDIAGVVLNRIQKK